MNYKELQALRGNFKMLLLQFVLATVAQTAKYLFHTAARYYNTNPKIVTLTPKFLRSETGKKIK